MIAITLAEAWDLVYSKYRVTNIYEAYIHGEDFKKEIQKIKKREKILADILRVEESFGIDLLLNNITYLEESMSLFTCRINSNFPKELDMESACALLEYDDEVEKLHKEVSRLRDTIYVEIDE